MTGGSIPLFDQRLLRCDLEVDEGGGGGGGGGGLEYISRARRQLMQCLWMPMVIGPLPGDGHQPHHHEGRGAYSRRSGIGHLNHVLELRVGRAPSLRERER